ncbi:F-box/kelch-repeat protein At3g23880 [Linum grandiflorum]
MKKYLSEEIVAHIISRVPTKSILRFKVACKSWCRLFDDPFFIRMHLRQIIPKGNSSLLLRHAVPEEKESSERNKKKKSVTYTSERHFKGNFSLRSMTTFRERSKPQLPIHWRERFTSIVGSAHGIVCIADRENNDLALWNPTTGELKHLPEFRKMTYDYIVVALGFTFNPKLKDYQVATVFISYCKPDFKAQVLFETKHDI